MLYAAASDSSIGGLYRLVVTRKTSMVKRAAQIWDELRRREPVRLLLPHAGQHFMGSAGCYSVHDLVATSDAVADALNAAISPTPGISACRVWWRDRAALPVTLSLSCRCLFAPHLSAGRFGVFRVA